MLVRTYRLADKLGVAFIKIAAAAVDALFEGAGLAVAAVWRVVALLLGALLALAGGLWRLLRALVGGVWRLLRALARGLWAVIRRVGLALAAVVGLLSGGVRGVSRAAGEARSGTMARRAARAEIDAGVVEDPLRAQNRTLSVVAVALLAVLLVVVVAATSQGQTAPAAAIPAAGLLPGTAAAPQATLAAQIPTVVPTATPVPAVLQARGSLAYTARQNGRDDIWGVNVGEHLPVRLVSSAADDRDPAWSPDGRRLAYASRQDGNWEIYINDVGSGETTRMTYDLSFQGGPGWSPDGAWLVYESYQGGNLDIYVMRTDGTDVRRLTEHPEPDFAPAWSPDGRRIAFVSWRDGNQDLYIFSLDDPRDAAVINLTNTPDRHESRPMWSPDGALLAYSAVDQGVEKVFVKSADDTGSPAQALGRGRTPAWSPDGTSLIAAVDSIEGTQFVALPFAEAGITTLVIPVAGRATAPSWTAVPLSQALVNAGGVGPAASAALYTEQETRFEGDPPYKLQSLIDVDTRVAALSDRVNDSFNALRERTLEAVGWDFLGQLEDAFWPIDRLPQPGEERRNWHMTGRSFAVNRNAIVGFPAGVEVVREDLGTDTYWRVFVRAAEDQQSGQLGEPLRAMPWDFLSRNQGDVEAYNQGGRLRASMPSGYYIDFTQLARDYGWDWVPAATDWRGNYNGTNFWAFQQRDGLTWLEAMREIYTEGQLGGFAQQQPAATPTGAINPSTPAFLPTPSATPSPAGQPTLPPPPTLDTGGDG